MVIFRLKEIEKPGFPTPHTDASNSNIDLNEILNIKKNSCFLFRTATDEMNRVGIFRDDIVVVDKSLPAQHGNIVLVVIDGEFSVRRLSKRGRDFRLLSDANKETELHERQEVVVWGVVTACLRRFI